MVENTVITKMGNWGNPNAANLKIEEIGIGERVLGFASVIHVLWSVHNAKVATSEETLISRKSAEEEEFWEREEEEEEEALYLRGVMRKGRRVGKGA